MIKRNKHGYILILELIRRDVSNDRALLNPRMTFSASLTKHIVKAATFVIFKILCKQKGSIATSPVGEVLEGDIERFRVTLHNCSPEGCSKLQQIAYISVDHGSSEVFISKSHPIIVV